MKSVSCDCRFRHIFKGDTAGSTGKNIVLDSGSEKQVILDRKRNAFRATPELEAM